MTNTPILDLLIMDTHSDLTLAVGDGSVYPATFNINTPTLQITPPNSNTVSVSFVPKSIQIFNAFSLGLTCSDDESLPLPDGIYSLKYSVYPSQTYNVVKTFLKVDSLYSKLDTAYLKLDITQCDQSVKRQTELLFNDIEFYIQGAIAAANKCSVKLAMDLYSKANKLIENYNKNLYNPCKNSCNGYSAY